METNDQTKMIQMITGAKGGCGKSTLFFLLAEKYREAVLLECDDATLTSTQNLAYRNPSLVSFLNDNKTIDRGLLNDFFEHLQSHEKKHFICDLGASISEQIPQYLKDIDPGELAFLLEQAGLHLQFVCVVGGADIFRSTMMYLTELTRATAGYIDMIIACNGFYALEEEQRLVLEKFAEEYGLPLIHFTISADKNVSTQNRIKQVMKSGTGVDGASAFSKMYFVHSINQLKL